MKLRPFSSQQRGMFISIDGPSGAGKSTIVRHLAQMLVAAGENVHLTAEPSNGPIGVMCRELTESLTGHALACLSAADRYHHLQTDIRPHIHSRRRMCVIPRPRPNGPRAAENFPVAGGLQYLR
jgi:dTMP kinase